MKILIEAILSILIKAFVIKVIWNRVIVDVIDSTNQITYMQSILMLAITFYLFRSNGSLISRDNKNV